MCGRADDHFGRLGRQVLTDLFGPLGWERESIANEVRPTDDLRFVRRVAMGYDAPLGRWGLVPPGMGVGDAKKYATFNAKAETLDERPMFRSAFRTQRCIIPLAGFWEWPERAGVKTRVRIARRDCKPLLVAGLWSRTETPDGPLESCTIVTRPPTPDLADVHGRMPALLLSRDIDVWLRATPDLARAAALGSWKPRILTVTPA